MERAVFLMPCLTIIDCSVESIPQWFDFVPVIPRQVSKENIDEFPPVSDNLIMRRTITTVLGSFISPIGTFWVFDE